MTEFGEDKRAILEPMLIAPNIATPHGFSTRLGGVSGGVYAAGGAGGLNVGGLNMDSRAMNGEQDDPAHVSENRRRLLAALGDSGTPAGWQLSLLSQVHGSAVLTISAATAASGHDLPAADAQVSAEGGVLLGIMTADCFPVLLHDPIAGVVGAAHAGWRGTAARIGARTVEAMQALGARPERIQAAIGVGICAEQYPVGPEVVTAMQQAGLSRYVQQEHADLAGANAAALQDAGVPAAHIWQAGGCSTEPQFYSYRRDAGRTGRMLAVIGMRA